MLHLPRRARSVIPWKHQTNTQKTHAVLSFLTGSCIIIYVVLGIRIGSLSPSNTNAHEHAIALLMDTSLSMSSTDIAPNRYEHMIGIISGLVQSYPAEYVAIPFGAMPLLRIPSTRDELGIRTVLGDDSLGSYHLSLDYMGSAPSNAVGFAAQELQKTKATYRTILLLGDGSINTGYNRDTFLPLLRTQNIRLVVCAIGKPGYVLGTRYDDSVVLSEVDTAALGLLIDGINGYWQLCNDIPTSLQFLRNSISQSRDSTTLPSIRERWANIRSNKALRIGILACILYQCMIVVYALSIYQGKRRSRSV